MSGDSLVWFLAGIGVGLAVAMLAFLLMSIADRRAITRQRRQSDARRSEAIVPLQVPQAIRLADIDSRSMGREPDRTAPRSAPRELDLNLEPQLVAAMQREPDFGLYGEPARLEGGADLEPEPVFDLSDLPEVTAPASVDAYVPSFERPIESPPASSRPGPRQAAPSPEPKEPVGAAEDPPPAMEVAESPPLPERLAIRRPAPPPRPLPAAARAKSQGQANPPAPTSPGTRPAPVSIAPLKTTVARTSGDGSRAPANFRPLLPKTDGAGRAPRPPQRRPFTEITVPFEGPAVLPDAPTDRPVAAATPVEAPSATTAAPPPSTAAPRAAAPTAAAPTTHSPATSASPAAAPTVAAPGAGVTLELAPPVEAPAATDTANALAIEPSPALNETETGPASAPDEVELDNAAAAAIEQGSGGSPADRTPSARPGKPLPKMPPPRLTPDTVEAIFAEAFARGSAEPPERKS